MKTIRLVCVFLSMILVLSCHKDNEVKTTFINGKIIDSIGNIPIKGVEIQLCKGGFMAQLPSDIVGYKVATDSLGAFLLKFDLKDEFLSTTEYYIYASKTGYNDVSNSIYHKIVLWERQNITIKMKKQN